MTFLVVKAGRCESLVIIKGFGCGGCLVRLYKVGWLFFFEWLDFLLLVRYVEFVFATRCIKGGT